MESSSSRRSFVLASGATLLLPACRAGGAERQLVASRSDQTPASSQAALAASARAPPPKPADREVGAVEDLMREHGVIRRVLIIYREFAARLRGRSERPPVEALTSAATLFRTFGEDYHERALEEARLFPAVRRSQGPLVDLVDTLTAQHERGREITGYVLAALAKPLDATRADGLSRALEGFARMYEAHAAYEDTIVFPAWKASLSDEELRETGEQFEEIERKTLGEHGFERAVEKVAAIERALGLSLADFTPPSPPRP